MSSRDLVTLYGVLLKDISNGLTAGICEAIRSLYYIGEFTSTEYVNLYKHFMTVDPPKGAVTNWYYFEPGHVTPRVNFIKHILKNLEEDGQKS